MTIKADLLVIAPHPDDSEFGIAGTVARWTLEGKTVVYVICTNGDKGTGDPSLKPEELIKIRQEEEKGGGEGAPRKGGNFPGLSRSRSGGHRRFQERSRATDTHLSAIHRSDQ